MSGHNLLFLFLKLAKGEVLLVQNLCCPITGLCSSFLCWLAGWVSGCLGLASQVLFQEICIATRADTQLIISFFCPHLVSWDSCIFLLSRYLQFEAFYLVLGSPGPPFLSKSLSWRLGRAEHEFSLEMWFFKILFNFETWTGFHGYGKRWKDLPTL